MKIKTAKTLLHGGLWAAAVTGILSVTPVHATILWQANPSRGSANFETLDYQTPGKFAVVNDPLGKYGSVFSYTIYDTGTGKQRMESKGTRTPTSTWRPANGQDFYVGWRAMWKPMPVNPGWVALMQLHGYGPSGQPAPIVLRCINNDGNVSLQNGVTGGNPDFWHTPLKLGVWQSFVLHIKISTSATTGYCEMWYNGVQQRDTSGNYRHYCQTLDPTSGSYDALKWGVYRSGAMDGKGPATAYMSGGTVATTLAEAMPKM